MAFEVCTYLEEKPGTTIQFDDTQLRLLLIQSANFERRFLL